MRRTKIIATLGPSTESENIIRQIAEYANGFRFNFSHGDHAYHEKMFRLAYDTAEEKNIALIADMRGPEIRTTNKEEIEVKNGKTYLLYNDIGITYKKLAADVKKGDVILVDDGKLEFVVAGIRDDDVLIKARTSGRIGKRRKLSVPGRLLSIPPLSKQDYEDLRMIAKTGFDVVAQSFVRTAEDIRLARKFLEMNGGEGIKIIAKIEHALGVENIEEIVKEADGIMVARGDLGVELPIEKLPTIQKKIIKVTKYYAKPVIIATHMLKSMVEAPMPTRAEAIDVANAIFEGVDGIMLSEETSVGAHPKKALEYMDRIARSAEKEREIEEHVLPSIDNKDAIARNAVRLAEKLGAPLIVPTMMGTSPRRIAKFRPRQDINVVVPVKKTAKFLALVYGINVKQMDYRPAFKNLDRMKKIFGVKKAVFVFGYPEGNWETNTILYY